MPYKDPKKQKSYLQDYQVNYHKSRYSKRIKEMKDYLGGECVKCGSVDNLEFDHIDPKLKAFSITRKWNRKWSILEPELNKCQLLCKNCHLKKQNSNASLNKVRFFV